MKKALSFFVGIVCFALLLCTQAHAVDVIYTYDSLNRIIAIDYGNGVIDSYTYDANGNRLILTTSSR